MNSVRCAICDKTNNPNLVNRSDGWTGRKSARTFTADPHDETSMICYECYGEIEEAVQGYEQDVPEGPQIP